MAKFMFHPHVADYVGAASVNYTYYLITATVVLTHHRAETPALPQATPSSAPSHIDATPEPVPEYIVRVPCSASRPGEPSKYERKPRRKTRPDRYDTSHQHRERKTLSRRERREEKRKELRLRKEVVSNFYCSATENRPVLVIGPPLTEGRASGSVAATSERCP
ncbi:hypothetical protein NHJ6243_002916 [Beauveria neobassiana]